MNIKKALSLMTSAAVCMSALTLSAFAENDNISEPAGDETAVAEEVSAEDMIRRGEGYYECHVSYRGGIPQIYAEDGAQYDLVGVIGGNLKEGETRESVENEAVESIKNDFVSIGVNPDDYPFDVYTYFYDDYDFTPAEFLDFIGNDIASREWEREHGDDNSEVPNPPMGTAFPCGAAALTALSAICLAAANKANRKKLS